MAKLSPEEKQKIYEEEWARLEARENFKNEGVSKKSSKLSIWFLFTTCIILAIFFGMYLAKTLNRQPMTGSTYIKKSSNEIIILHAKASFKGTQIEIINRDPFDWKDVEIEINAGYKFTLDTIESGATHWIEASLFRDSNGKKLDPVKIKPKEITISTNTKKGRGYYFGSLKWPN